jgi:hypothetical protein
VTATVDADARTLTLNQAALEPSARRWRRSPDSPATGVGLARVRPLRSEGRPSAARR